MNDNEIDKYLFNEMPEAARDQFEEKLVREDELFYEISERENELVDLYAKGKLTGDELVRFEQGLDGLPARRQKIENAKILREFVQGERVENKAITIAERSGWFASLVSFGPVLQFAALGLIFLLGLTSFLLLKENRRLGSLDQELAASRQRETELASQVESERDASGDLTADLDAERERIRSLEAEIANLRNANDIRPVDTPPVTIATLVLSSFSVRGGSVPVRRLELAPGVTRVSIVIGVPPDVASGDHVGVKLNGEQVAENLKSRTRGGENVATLIVPVSKLKPGRNELALLDGGGKVIASHVISVMNTP